MRSKDVVAALMALALTACSTGAQQGAERGAKTGAVGGLVAGAVGSIFWGGDAVNNALRSAAVGASSGAAVGAMHGAEQEKNRQPAPTPAAKPAPSAGAPVHDPAMKAKIGELNFAASEDLARCRHVSAISKAEQAFKAETDPKRRSYALLVEAIAAEESNNTGKANEVYAQWGRFDPVYADRGKARSEALDGVLKLQKVRQDQGLPPLCT